MGGDRAASLLVLVGVVIAGIVAAVSRRARRGEVLPSSKVRELQGRLSTSHENLRKKAK